MLIKCLIGGCCNGGTITVQATGDIAKKCPVCLGDFNYSHHSMGNPVFRNSHDKSLVLGDGFWWIRVRDGYTMDIMSAGPSVDCPEDATRWIYYPDGYIIDENRTKIDAPVTVTCT